MNTKRKILQNCQISGFADEIHADVDKQIETLKTLGISCVEFRSGNGINVANYTIKQAEELKRKFEHNQIQVSAIGSPVGKMNIHDDMDVCMKQLRHIVDIAEVMDTKNIRMFSFYMPQQDDPSKHRDEVLKRMDKMVQYAASRNVMLLHENEKGIYGDIAQRCLDLMQNFYGDAFGCTFDFANFVECGQDTMEAYEMLESYITYVHVKDALRKEETIVLPGEGDGRLKEIFLKLHEKGYHGFLSMEPHLVDFSGLQGLEQAAKKRGRTDGEDAFAQAYRALEQLLK